MADKERLIDNDKISRQALLDEINEEIEYGEEHFHPENEQINKGLKIARKLVRTAPAIEAEPDNGWISVKDRLPDDKERYLICTDGGRIDIAYYQPTGDKFSDYEPFWQGSCRFTTSGTHWQPLPEPPKGE